MLEAGLRALPDPQADRPPPRPGTLPALLQHRTLPHRSLDQGPDSRGGPREGQTVAEEALMRRHNSGTGHVRGPRAATFPHQHEPAQVHHVRPGKVVERGPLRAIQVLTKVAGLSRAFLSTRNSSWMIW